ncbi:MAG: 2-oxoacid:acceptor oxidoreductase family protein [Oscillospiraceae bacterium]|jgi:indolepyruvate ferredoxin oxidoreductase beta subunit|nr:2-oxoacid:acceptor oxidoreductase family protein [Oscillospiraceae bacterium]
MNILLAGVGGQGTVLASKLLAQCALDKGEAVHTAETIGMAQRGGSVVSHVRIGAGAFSPLIPKAAADMLIGFEPSEAVRCLPYLKPNGIVIVSTRGIMPTTGAYNPADMLSYLKTVTDSAVFVDAEDVYRVCGSYRPLNIALLGAAAATGKLGFTVSDLERAMRAQMSAKNAEANLPALALAEALK